MEDVTKIDPPSVLGLELESLDSEPPDLEPSSRPDPHMKSELMEPLVLESLKQEPLEQGLMQPKDELGLLEPSVSISPAETDRITPEKVSFIKTEHTENERITPEHFSFIKTEHTETDRIKPEQFSFIKTEHTETDRIKPEHFSFIKTEHTETDRIKPEQFSFIKAEHTDADWIKPEKFSFIKTEHTGNERIKPEQFNVVKTEHSYSLPCGGIEMESKALETLSNIISSDSVSHHANDSQVICSLCKRSFLNKAGLQRHIQYMHCRRINGQDSLTRSHEHSKSTRKHQKYHEKHVQNERDERANLRKMFVCLGKEIKACKNNTTTGKEDGSKGLHLHVLNVLGMQIRSRLHMQSIHVPHKEEQGSNLASKKHILRNAIKLVHSLQAREIDLKAEKKILLERRSALAEHYLNLRSEQDIPICRAFVQWQNEVQYLQDCLSKNYTGCFYPRVRLLDISKVSHFTISSKECEGTNMRQHSRGQTVTRVDKAKGRYWLIRNAENLKINRNLSFKGITESKENNACNKVLGDTSSALKGNLNINIHPVHHKRFSCTLCDKSFAVKRSMLDHVKTHTRTKIMKEFICTTCEKQFVSKRTLNKHINLVHIALKGKTYVHRTCRKGKTMAQGTFTCRFCKITLGTLRGLGNHEKFCEKLWNQKNKTTDGQTFSQSDPKSNEELIETFNAALRCPSCKRYYRKDKLKQHTMSCQHDAKTQSHSDSILNQDATGTGDSIPNQDATGTGVIVISPIQGDSYVEDGYTLGRKTETPTDQSE